MTLFLRAKISGFKLLCTNFANQNLYISIKLGRITRPRLAIRQKLAASENIRV